MLRASKRLTVFGQVVFYPIPKDKKAPRLRLDIVPKMRTAWHLRYGWTNTLGAYLPGALF